MIASLAILSKITQTIPSDLCCELPRTSPGFAWRGFFIAAELPRGFTGAGHSITSSAWPISVAGTETPSVSAVLRFRPALAGRAAGPNSGTGPGCFKAHYLFPAPCPNCPTNFFGFGPVLLQKSKVAGLRIFRENMRRKAIEDPRLL